MDHAAPAVFQALEASGLAAGIRQSVWLYPLANIAHVVAVVVFFAAVAVMDLRLIGALRATAPGPLLRAARRAAIVAFAAVAATGAMLFSAEASHLALNLAFQVKVALIALALANVALFEFGFGRAVYALPAGAAIPTSARLAAAGSLAIWIAVVVCGRGIAYV